MTRGRRRIHRIDARKVTNPITIDRLITGICPPLDRVLAQQFFSEYVSQEKRYVLGDWEPATLDGGQFVEAAARIIYHQDCGTPNLRKTVDDCLKYAEDNKGQFPHSFPERKAVKHLAKVLRTIYKFRSDRGAVHIDPDYTANQLDSKLVIECCKWVVSEILRLFWTADREEVARAVKEILTYEVPAVGNYDGHLIVQRVDCSIEEEILLLLYWTREVGLSRTSLGQFVRRSAPDVTKGIQSLVSKREVIHSAEKYRLTDLGTRRVLRDLGNKVILPE